LYPGWIWRISSAVRAVWGGNGNNTWGRTATGFASFASKPGAADADDDYAVFNIRPSVKLNLNNRTFVEIGDSINIDSANFDGYRKDGKAVSAGSPGDTKSRLSNVFYVDLKWSF
jgi:hypothetical protein